jgi:hypothetical protein
VIGNSRDRRILFTDAERIFEAEIHGDRQHLEGLLLRDLLHLNEAGHELYFGALRSVVEQAIGSLVTSAD